MENLNKLNLYDLRNIAREIGVRAPTALTKEDLINEIHLIRNGYKSPYYSKRGRPIIVGQDEKDFLKRKEKLKEQLRKEVVGITTEMIRTAYDLIDKL